MSSNCSFNDDDDDLLNSVFTTSSNNTTLVKRLNDPNDENGSLKKAKLDDHDNDLSPEIKFCGGNNPSSVKRIFPGPAGILADENQTEACSQRTSSIFQDGSWNEMSKDFKIGNMLHLYDKFNIAWIKKEATKNEFANQKAPFLAAVLLSLEVSDGQTQKSVNITLKDKTGTIQGNILYSFYEEYANHFTLGSVLILVQFGVLSCTCDKCDNYHLTITPKNLSAIYNKQANIVIKKIEPQEVLLDFIRHKQELAISTKSKALAPQRTGSNDPVSFIQKNSFSVNNKIGYQSLGNSKNVCFSNLNSTHCANISSSKEAFGPSKHKNICEGSIENRRVLPTKNDINENKNSKLFTFKKVPLSEVMHRSTDVLSQGSLNNPNKNIDYETSGNRSIEFLINVPQETNSNKTTDVGGLGTEKNMNVNNSSTGVSSEFKTLFNYDNKPSLQDTCNSTGNASEIIKLVNPHSSVKKPGSYISVKVDNAEHEELWKDVLGDVDINALFDDDF